MSHVPFITATSSTLPVPEEGKENSQSNTTGKVGAVVSLDLMPNYINHTFLEFLIYVQLGSLGLRPLVSSEQSCWQMSRVCLQTLGRPLAKEACSGPIELPQRGCQ